MSTRFVRLRRVMIGSICAIGLAAPALDARSHEHASNHVKKPTKTATVLSAHRAVVADAAEPILYVLDLETGKVLVKSSVASPARLGPGTSSRYVLASLGAAGEVRLVDTGLMFEDHGDHADLEINTARLLPATLKGPKPSHLNQGGGQIVVFFDGEGAAKAISQADFAAGRMDKVEMISTGIAHHGVAKPVGAALAVSVPKDGENLPVAIELRTRDGKSPQRVECPRLHGEGKSGRFTAFGCADGVAVFEETRSGIVARKLAYPATLPTGRMVRNMDGAAGYTLLAADFGPDGMVVIDPGKPEDIQYIALPARRMYFALDEAAGDNLFVIVEDGRVLKINTLTGKTVGEAGVTARYAMEPGVVRPRLSVAGDVLVVSNPAAGEVVVLDKETLAIRRRVALGGAPFDVLAVGGKGAAH